MAGFALSFQKMKIIFCLVMVGLVAICADARAQLDELIEKGDRLEVQLKNKEALEVYLEAEKIAPNDSTVLQRISKQYGQMMADTTNRGEQKRLGDQALDYALRSKAANPNSGDARLAVAICYGKVAFFEGPGKKIEYSRFVKDEAEAAVRLNPNLDYGWHVLGRWQYEMATLNPALKAIAQTIYGKFPDASLEQAAEYLERAVKTGPPRVVHHTELGRTYAGLGRKEEARAQLQKALQLPSREKDDRESKERAQKALSSL